MDDLISRQALIEEIYRLKQQVFLSEEVGHTRPFSDKANIIECINNQPTAYDVDEVIETIEKLYCSQRGYISGAWKERIISIVKGE
jgi:hypothetical protein